MAVIEWELSSTLAFCLSALERALGIDRPQIFNADQGSQLHAKQGCATQLQFTSHDFTSCLEHAGIEISMDGRGRALDNIFVERLWRTVKQENIYLSDYAPRREANLGLHRYFRFYNEERPHQSLRLLFNGILIPTTEQEVPP